ncbi:hypothetical protein O0235_02410 [Tepidiforma flava]|uniref:Uncharacterized protein n=1 Tax=Tepidiforma flava TaxID=3004094 RepID=A0ABY7M7C5_9CHLR|nr:hypothetical protein [Tepidiforma flava]WBL36440.1 hypothetical protein O0235_02410 [Tepidiforma flava]
MPLLPGRRAAEDVGEGSERLSRRARGEDLEDGEGAGFVGDDFFEAGDDDVLPGVGDAEGDVAFVFDDRETAAAGDGGVGAGDGRIAVLEVAGDDVADVLREDDRVVGFEGAPARARRSRMRARLRWTAGAVMWLGPRPSRSTMYSPMSVSRTSAPASRSARVRPISSATMDFDLATRRASPSRRRTISTASAAVAARW